MRAAEPRALLRNIPEPRAVPQSTPRGSGQGNTCHRCQDFDTCSVSGSQFWAGHLAWAPAWPEPPFLGSLAFLARWQPAWPALSLCQVPGSSCGCCSLQQLTLPLASNPFPRLLGSSGVRQKKRRRFLNYSQIFFFWLDLNKMIIFGLFIFVPCWVVALGSVVAISCPAVPLKMGLFLHNQFGFCFSH